MVEYLWAFYALGSALACAFMFLASEYFKQGGIGYLMIIRGGTALTLLPFVLFAEFPVEPLFYLYGAIAYIMFPIADIMLFSVNLKYGSGVLTRFLPLTAIITFFIWLLLDIETVKDFVDKPVLAAGIMLCLVGIVYCASSLRKCEVSTKAFKTLLPALFLLPVGGIFIKLAMDQTELSSAALVNLFIGSFIGVITYGILYKFSKAVRSDFVMSKVTVKAGIIASIFSTLLIYLATVAFDLSSNPAYVTAVSFTSALWVLVIYKLIGRQDDSRILPGLGIVFFTAVLVVLSSL